MTDANLITIRFGSVGSSYFYVLAETDKKLTGLRWQPSYDRTSGVWGGIVHLKPQDRTTKVPTCPRPSPPTLTMIDKRQRQYVANAEKVAALTKLGKAIAKAIKAGKTVRGTFARRDYQADVVRPGAILEVKGISCETAFDDIDYTKQSFGRLSHRVDLDTLLSHTIEG